MVAIYCFPLIIFFYQEKEMPAYQIKAHYIINFIHFVSWPQENQIDTINIVVVGESKVGNYLKDFLADKKIKGKPIKIRVVSRPSNVTDKCHVLYLAEERYLREVLQKTSNKPILTIGDNPGLGRRGIIINLFEEEQRIKFEINREAGKGHQLSFDFRLLEIGRIVN